MEYLEQARKYAEDRFGADVDELTADVLDRWESVLTRLAEDPMLTSRELDWVAKLEMLEGYRARDGLAWGHPRLQLVDLQYSDVRPDRGLYNRLAAAGRMKRLVTDEQVTAGDHRAAGRHPGLLPRPVPAQVPRRGRRRVLGLGHLRHPGPRVAAARADPGAAARHPGACRGRCSTAAGPLASWWRADRPRLSRQASGGCAAPAARDIPDPYRCGCGRIGRGCRGRG